MVAPKNEIVCSTKKKIFAPNDLLTVMLRTFASTDLVTCHNRSTIFLVQMFRSLVTNDFPLVSNDIEHLVQVFG
jgi:hypothetical protein